MSYTIYEQGDSFYIAEPIPKNAKETDLEKGIVEHGEATGHAHRLDAENWQYFETPEKTRHLKIVKPVALRHEEHETIILPPGDYRIGRVREKEMFGDLINPVVD